MMPRLDLHPRTLRSNIWRGLLCATDQEINEGMSFYEGAHGLCRLFASIYRTTTSHVAGIYAALSPMNTWDTNVANIVDVLRYERNPSQIDSPLSVNTTHKNRDKALAIARGADPLTVLGGRKILAFYRAIADLNDRSSVPVDRHLICLALGRKITSNLELSATLRGNLYSRIESAYLDLGRREGLGNRLASIAWFVQRRIANDQIPLYHPDSPVCCNRAMWTQGAYRFQCGQCKRTRIRETGITPKRKYDLPPTILTDYAIPRSILSVNSKGRLIIYLGTGHRYARSGGVNYLARYIVESHLGHRLRSDEHVHHHNGIQSDCRLSNLEVWLAERHGRHHARTQLLYMFRDEKGRFKSSEVPTYSDQHNELTSDIDCDFDLSSTSLSASDHYDSDCHF